RARLEPRESRHRRPTARPSSPPMRQFPITIYAAIIRSRSDLACRVPVLLWCDGVRRARWASASNIRPHNRVTAPRFGCSFPAFTIERGGVAGMEASLAVQVDGQLVFITRRMNAALA